MLHASWLIFSFDELDVEVGLEEDGCEEDGFGQHAEDLYGETVIEAFGWVGIVAGQQSTLN